MLPTFVGIQCVANAFSFKMENTGYKWNKTLRNQTTLICFVRKGTSEIGVGQNREANITGFCNLGEKY